MDDRGVDAFHLLLQEGGKGPGPKTEALEALSLRPVWLATWEPRAGVYPPRDRALRGDVHDARMAAAVRKAASDFAAALRIR